MSATPVCTALVLAGTRPGGDALARHAGVTHKALLEIGGMTMLARVLAALAAVPAVARILVAIDRPELLSGLPACGKPVLHVATASGPSATVAAVLRAEGVPLLVTTADHALLRPAWIEEFLDAARSGAGAQADALLALARREAVQAAAPDTQRTWLRFAEGDYSGCNLFLLQTPAAASVVRLWQEIEAQRKRPMQLLGRLGFTYVLRYRLGWLTLAHALRRLDTLTGARLAPVILSDGRAAIDVDKPADLELVRRLTGSE